MLRLQGGQRSGIRRPSGSYVRNDRAKRFFRHNLGVFGRVIENCWLYEVAFARFHWLTTSCKPITFRFAVIEEGLHFVELHSILDGSEVDIRVEWATNFQIIGVRGHGFEEWLVDGVMDVDPFTSNANLQGM